MFTVQMDALLQYPIYLLQSPPVSVAKIRTSNIGLRHENQSHLSHREQARERETEGDQE